MAFLSNEEREIVNYNNSKYTLSENNNKSSAGPGSYDTDNLTILIKVNKTFNRHLPGFNSKETKDKNGIIQSQNQLNVPGPGAYMLNTLSNKYNKFNYKGDKDKDIGFLSKDIRLKYKFNNVPGPGNYDGETNYYQKYEEKYNIKKNAKFEHMYKYNKPRNKEQMAEVGGYNLDLSWKKGAINWSKGENLSNNCIKYNNTCGNNDDKFYEMRDNVIKIDNRKFKDVKVMNGSFNNNKSNINNNNESNSCNSNSNSIRTFDIFFNIKNKDRENYLKSLVNKSAKDNNEFIKSFNSSNNLYQDAGQNTAITNKNILSPIRQIKRNELLHLDHMQFFNTTSTRDSQKINDPFNPDAKIEKIGPGFYSPKIDILSKSKAPYEIKLNHKKHSIKKTYKYHKGINDLLITSYGPCNKNFYYSNYLENSNSSSTAPNNNINNIINNNNKYNKTFGTEIRFKYENSNAISVGPGDYDNNYKTIKKPKEKTKHKQPITASMMDSANYEILKNQRMYYSINNLEDNKVPPVGSYEINDNNCISKNVEKRIKKYNSCNNSKGNNQIRYRNITENNEKIRKTLLLQNEYKIVNDDNSNNLTINIIGNGRNRNSKENIKSNGDENTNNCLTEGLDKDNYAPFNSNTIRGSNLLGKTNKELIFESNIGPGTYLKPSYFDWNKKSFNIKY